MANRFERRDGRPRSSNPLPLAVSLSVRGVAVQLGVAPFGGGRPLRPVSLQRFGVAIVSCGASLTRCGDAERSLPPLRHLVRMHQRLAGTLLGARQAVSGVLGHNPPLSRRPQELGAQGRRAASGETSRPSTSLDPGSVRIPGVTLRSRLAPAARPGSGLRLLADDLPSATGPAGAPRAVGPCWRPAPRVHRPTARPAGGGSTS